MNTTIKNIQLKRAWQTAFELRLCPDSETLFAETLDENLQKHLQICHVCREKKEMPSAQRAAWQEVHQWFTESVSKPAKPQPVPCQVWSLKGSLAGWGKDGYFYKPPLVLLIEKIEGSRGFKVVQLYDDRLLMGEGDVWLENDRFGFAQGWNCYSLHDEALDGCWGRVTNKVLGKVQAAVAMKHAPVEEDSILYFFRRMEINVGARIAVPSVAVLVEEMSEEIVTVMELVQGVKLELVRTGKRLKEGILTLVHDGLDAISGHFAPQLCLAERSVADEVKDNSEIDLLANDARFQYVPTGIYVADGNAHIIMRFLTPCGDKPQVFVKFRNVSIDSNHISWNGLETKNPELVIVGVSFTLAEEKKANPLLVMHVSEGSTIFDIMPE